MAHEAAINLPSRERVLAACPLEDTTITAQNQWERHSSERLSAPFVCEEQPGA
jgi:hypothetical protein